MHVPLMLRHIDAPNLARFPSPLWEGGRNQLNARRSGPLPPPKVAGQAELSRALIQNHRNTL